MKTKRLWIIFVALGIVVLCNSTVPAQGGWRGWEIHMLDGTQLEANPLGMNEAGRFTRGMDPKQPGIERSKVSYLEIGRRENPPLPEGDFKEDMVVLEDGTKTFGAVTFRDLKFSEGIVIQNGKEISTEKIIYIKFAQPKKKKTSKRPVRDITFMPRDNQPDRSHVATVEEIRSHFPALKRVHNDKPVAYFDGPGGTQVPTSVVEAMNDYLFYHNANTHWEYPSSNETDRIIDESRETIADFINASPDEIVFGQNMTTLTFHLSRALGRQFESGDEIVVTELDHHANSDTWRALARDCDLTIRVLPMNVETGQLEIDRLAGLLCERTRLVAIGAASNILGTINDVETVCNLAREAGALSFVDAVHYAAHELIDVKKIGCDFLYVSAYKFYGPHIGLLYGRKELLDSLDTPKLRPAPDYSPDRLETGTQNHEGIAGVAAAVEFLASLATGGSRRERLVATFNELHQRQHEMFKLMWDGLSSIPGVIVYGPPPEAKRTSTVSFSVAGHKSDDVARTLASHGLFLSDGDFYASTVLEKLGVGGLVRAGLACYTTEHEVERLVSAIRSISDSQQGTYPSG